MAKRTNRDAKTDAVSAEMQEKAEESRKIYNAKYSKPTVDPVPEGEEDKVTDETAKENVRILPESQPQAAAVDGDTDSTVTDPNSPVDTGDADTTADTDTSVEVVDPNSPTT